MSNQTPPPTQSGYQPVPGEGITGFTVEANPGKDYASARQSLQYVFPEPRALTDVIQVKHELQQAVNEDAFEAVKQIVAGRDAAEAAAKQANAQRATGKTEAPAEQEQAQQQSQGQQDPKSLPFRNGRTKKGNRFIYLPQDAVDSARLAKGAKAKAAENGLPEDELFVSDKRRFLEQGESAPAVALIHPAQNSSLEQLAGKNALLGFVYWEKDGDVTVSLSNDGEDAVDQIADGNLQAIGATEVGDDGVDVPF